jgi:hypothetical protein
MTTKKRWTTENGVFDNEFESAIFLFFGMKKVFLCDIKMRSVHLRKLFGSVFK